MQYSFLGPEPVDLQLRRFLDALAEGKAPKDIETENVDCKEEPGRRDGSGAVQPGRPENPAAAEYFAGELACLSNTAGGGALVVGISNDGNLIGTDLDVGWLRHRIFELTERLLTVEVQVVQMAGYRLLLLKAPEAAVPIPYRRKYRWRVDDHCEEVDPASWMSGRLHRLGADWSALGSAFTLDDASKVALEIARRYLREAGDEAALDLANASDADLLRRVHVLKADGHLTNAGVLLFIGPEFPAIDYLRRDAAGGDTRARINRVGPLIELLREIEQVADATNRGVSTGSNGGFAIGQHKALPPRAIREAIVNGLTHRDWNTQAATVVEFVGDRLIVQSPGGFVGGVTPQNIITHPASPRYRSLAEAMAGLRLAEREGIGVDRMVRDMILIGHRPPIISEIPGPFVVTTLIGGDANADWLSFLAKVEPLAASQDVDMLLLIDQLVKEGWTDATKASPVLQRTTGEAEDCLIRLERLQFGQAPLAVRVAGVPTGAPPAWRLSDLARKQLAERLPYLSAHEDRRSVLLDWATRRRRISSTEAGDLVRMAPNNIGRTLQAMVADGVLEPGREEKMGRGFFYRPRSS